MARDPATATLQVPGTLDEFTARRPGAPTCCWRPTRTAATPETVATVREFAASSLSDIEGLTGPRPPEAQPALRDAALALRDIDARASRLCDTCADLPALDLPEAFLASAEVTARCTASRRRASTTATRSSRQADAPHGRAAAARDVRRRAAGRSPPAAGRAPPAGAQPPAAPAPAVPAGRPRAGHRAAVPSAKVSPTELPSPGSVGGRRRSRPGGRATPAPVSATPWRRSSPTSILPDPTWLALSPRPVRAQ